MDGVGMPADHAGTAMTIRVLLVDDHGAIRAGLRLILDAEPDVTVVGEAADGAVALRQARALRPDVVVMDVRMPRIDGIAATAAIVAETAARVLLLTSFDVDDYVLGGLRAGAAGYLLKTVEADDLVAAVRTVHAGGAVLGPEVTAAVVAAVAAAPTPPMSEAGAGDPLAGLTARERQVHDWLAVGRSNRQIARELGIGENTVKTHVARVLRKLGLSSRVDVAVRAGRLGPDPRIDPR